MILLDTDVLIDVANAKPSMLGFIRSLVESGEELGTTSLNMAEFLRGVPPGRGHAEVLALVGALTQVPFGPAAARRYGGLMYALDRAGTKLDALDGAIAAVALENGGRLITRNRKRFERVAGLELLGP